jgi:hypothetical protein
MRHVSHEAFREQSGSRLDVVRSIVGDSEALC